MLPRILWIENKRSDMPAFIDALREKDYLIDVVPTGVAAVNRLSDFKPDLAIVYAATIGSNGKRICSALRRESDSLPLLVIIDAQATQNQEAYANEILVLPFTSRKLLSRINSLLPWKEQDTLVAGPIQLDVKKRRVRCFSRQARLTPHLVILLKTLIENRGVIVERASLFRKVWNTEYTGDTRTLDVHISWLRHAIEENPHAPALIKTERGVGYRLDV
jgi:DNA-binding response OmpR family regulator